MIYFLSDLHGNMNFSGLKKYIEVAGEDDLLIILGDVGLNLENTEENHKFDEYFLSIKKTLPLLTEITKILNI